MLEFFIVYICCAVFCATYSIAEATQDSKCLKRNIHFIRHDLTFMITFSFIPIINLLLAAIYSGIIIHKVVGCITRILIK
jgi:hypothetical protein